MTVALTLPSSKFSIVLGVKVYQGIIFIIIIIIIIVSLYYCFYFRCSDGIDRHRQEWLLSGCHNQVIIKFILYFFYFDYFAGRYKLS